METFIISLSPDNIATELLAESALRHFVSADRPAPLTPDRREALLLLISSTAAAVAAQLAPLVVACEQTASDDDAAATITLTLYGNPDTAAQTRRAIEHLIALRVASRIYATTNPTIATSLASQATTLLTSLSALSSLSSLSSSKILSIAPTI